MTALLCDLDGVIYQADRPIPGAADAIGWFRERAIPHLFLTNTSSRPRRAIVEKLRGMGLEIHAEEILTPPVATVDWLRARGLKTAALFVREATREDFAGIRELPGDRETGAEAVVVGDLGEAWDFATLNRAFRLLMAEPRPVLIALGMTRYWRGADGLRLDTAPFVAALRHASGAEPVVLGKPAEPFFRTALETVGLGARETWIIGDDIRGDIEGAQAVGVRGILVRTGKFRPTDLESGVTPSAVLDSVAQLPDWWRANACP